MSGPDLYLRLDAAHRAAVVDYSFWMERTGLNATASVSATTAYFKVSSSTVWRWRMEVTGVERDNWIAVFCEMGRIPSRRFARCTRPVTRPVSSPMSSRFGRFFGWLRSIAA